MRALVTGFAGNLENALKNKNFSFIEKDILEMDFEKIMDGPEYDAEREVIAARLEFLGVQKGDSIHTYANISKAKRIIGYKLKIKLKDGLEREAEYIKA